MKRPMTQRELDQFLAGGGQITRVPMGVSGQIAAKGSPWRRLRTMTPAADADAAAVASVIMRHDVAQAD